jgi:hypothetical protein
MKKAGNYKKINSFFDIIVNNLNTTEKELLVDMLEEDLKNEDEELEYQETN